MAACFLAIAFNGHPQGVFYFSTVGTLRTRLGSVDGPLAGSGIWAQMLAGPQPDSLAPVGMPAEFYHPGGVPTGLVICCNVAVPGVLPFQTAYVKMVAWDGTRWGTALSGVPPDQLGMTDIVPVRLTFPDFGPPPLHPEFTQPAIVPIPEPAVLALAVFGGLSFLPFRRIRNG